MDKSVVESLIFDAVKNLNTQIPSDQHLQLDRGAVLLGAGGALDSLGVVNLIVAVEEKIDSKFGKFVSLANEEYLVAESSPFKTLGGLIDHVYNLMSR